LGTLIIVGIFATAMIASNTHFTILDDEANGLAVAGRPVVHALRPYLFNDGGNREFHPPEAEILWHLWMVATGYSFFLLRVLANLGYMVAVLFTAKSAEQLAKSRRAYWAALAIGLGWPFAFQYGRIAGWYTLSTCLLSVVTWMYLQLRENPATARWVWFSIACVAFSWSNYFAFVFLMLLLADLVLFHRAVAMRSKWRIAMTMMLVAVAFAPLMRIAFGDVIQNVGAASTGFNLKHEIARVGYPVFAMFGSSALAPWFWPLSIPVGVAAVVLAIAIWKSAGRRWMLYTIVPVLAMELTRVLDVKRVLIFLPWLFLAVVLSLFDGKVLNRGLAGWGVLVMMLVGWIGIAWGEHYATTNLREPWAQVARVVARDARQGATVISENPPFFFYLDYELGLEKKMDRADSADLGADLYRAEGFTILEPELAQQHGLHGKVVMVRGPGLTDAVDAMRGLDVGLAARCGKLGEFRAAPDPAFAWKQRFTQNVDLLAYRTDVTWYDCH
jgi:hypothetical protein